MPDMKGQTDKVSNRLLNLVEYLSAEEPDFFSRVGGDQNGAKPRVNIGLTFEIDQRAREEIATLKRLQIKLFIKY